MTKWVKRLTIGAAAVGVAGLLLFNLFQVQIAERVFSRVLEQNIGVDRSAALPDGIHVYLCGTGAPLPDVARNGPCLGVLAGDRAFVFDVGAGGVRRLGAMGFPIARLDKIYLTHLHSDHIDGLGELLLLAWIAGGRAEPMTVAGPVGSSSVVEGFNAAYRLDAGYRVAHHGVDVANPDGFGGMAEEIVLPMGPDGRRIVLEEGDLKITAIRVAHAPVEPAFGYRIDYKERSISISGDTIYHPGFVAASKGVDLMLHEALDPEMVGALGDQFAAVGQTSNAKIAVDILDYHASPEDAARAAQAAGAAALTLYHIVPPLPVKLLEPVFLGEAKSLFDGPVHVGEDGVIFSLPAGSDAINQSGP